MGAYSSQTKRFSERSFYVKRDLGQTHEMCGPFFILSRILFLLKLSIRLNNTCNGSQAKFFGVWG